MELMESIAITDSMVTANNITEPSARETALANWQGEYLSATSYAVDALVMVTTTANGASVANHGIYKSLTASNSGNDPITSSANWEFQEFTDAWKLFSDILQDQSEFATQIDVSIKPGEFFNSCALLNIADATQGTLVSQLDLSSGLDNILTYTEQFDHAAWGKAGPGAGSAPVVTPNAGIAPDGEQTADRIQFDCGDISNAANRSYIVQSGIAVSSGVDYSESVYIKAYDISQVGKTLRIVTEGAIASSIITLTEEWQRVAATDQSSTTSANFLIETCGTYTEQTADVLIWGAQLEQASEATNYERVEAGGSAVELVYAKQFSLIDNSHVTDIDKYFFEPSRVLKNHFTNDIPPHNTATLTAKIDSGSSAKIGKIAIGLSTDIGETSSGAVLGILDFSTKTTDSAGRSEINAGSYADTGTINTKLKTSNAGAVTRKLQDLRATPSVWVGDSLLAGTIVYGYPKEWKMTYESALVSNLRVNVEGLG